jgi:uncharacterized membrane protein YdjX (TVP38/TMEM64 family)
MIPTRRRFIRLTVLAVLAVALFVVAWTTGLRERFTVNGMRAMMAAAGGWGVLIYSATYCAGLLLYIPGTVFFAVAVLAWGPWIGGVISFLASNLAVTVTFLLVRAAGGQPLGETSRPIIKKAMARLEHAPIRTVILLRFVLWTSPPLNYAFALSSLKFRDHLIGSAIGLVVPVLIMALFTEQAIRLLGL